MDHIALAPLPLEEVRARGAHVIAVATAGSTQIEQHAEHVLYVPRTRPELQPILAVLPLQLLAYKIAGRLGLEGMECSDPYVERLLEGFAFLAARVQLKIDSEFPRFTQHLMEMVFPGFISPVPAMAIFMDAAGCGWDRHYRLPPRAAALRP